MMSSGVMSYFAHGRKFNRCGDWWMRWLATDKSNFSNRGDDGEWVSLQVGSPLISIYFVGCLVT